jgi:hypothetical protein
MARTSAKRGPGRPARLSREGILEAALGLLEREPGEALGVARIAACARPGARRRRARDPPPRGLAGAGPRLARAYLWILETTCGIAMQEASLSLPDQIESARAALVEMSAEGRARMAKLGPHLARLDGDAFFAFVADRTIEALVALVEAR